ncbi:MAG: cadmium-translocating P-type ATPase [Acetatifactor sp.]|nr:cadmium-translocating P-type ATPase [Acetatifactor sp.]
MTKKQKKVLYRIIISAVLLVILHFVPVEGYARFLLYLIPYAVIGYDILRKAVLGVLHGEVFDENFLMAVATVGAMALGVYQVTKGEPGEFAEGVAVMLFYQVGELFQSVAVGKSRRNISALMDIRPDYANVQDEDGNWVRTDPEDVEIGTIILVQPGEKIPIDGVVAEGNSSLNTAALTGESKPRTVHEGDTVISGCVNLNGVLKIQTSREFGESTVAKILELVENSGMKKAQTEKFITKFAKYYTPAVCCSALALAVLPPIINGLMGNACNWESWLIRALTFLVISCPCALVISIPLSFFGGIGGAGAAGILVKGSNYLEALARAEIVVFDKTGTLTEGVFKVTQCQVSSETDLTESEVLRLAAYAESFSTHPISKSLREAYGGEINRSLVSDVEEIGGHGVLASVEGKKIAAGNGKLMQRLHIPFRETDSVGTVVYVAVDGTYAGYLLISDVVKEQSQAAIASLKKAGVKKTVMLTGDSRRVAETIADQLGIDAVKSELLPGEKVSAVEELLENKSKKGQLVFVGDGINDAPVLTRADIGVAMGALGSDAAIEAADIVLMDDDPMKLVRAIRISRKTLRIVYENIVFALGIKAICLILGALGFAGMWLAIFADVGVMVLAVLNAVRCLQVKK